MELIKEIHTMIVWSNASKVTPDIEKEIKRNFNLISRVEISWEKEKFLDNLKVFYSHSQKHRTEDVFDNILINKIAHCGDEQFTLFVYEDKNPTYDSRVTSSGNRKVNTNVFDFKKRLRESLGGGHKIHASDNTFESNKDLTLLFGLNSKDFINQHLETNQSEEVFKENCIGIDGYKNIEQFFYVLNNSINYCVIRNYECLPEKYTIEGHGDIDLLVEDLNYIKYLTLAKSYYPDLDYRVHYGINIANELIPFDFRYVGDDYYDINWQNQILNNLAIFNSVVKVPDTHNYFYSLIYHAYVQKNTVKVDYFERLEMMSQELNINYNSDLSLEKIKEILDEFMIQNNFDYTTPKDKTVYFNQLFLNFDNTRTERYGKLISTQQARLDNEVLFTEVYDNGTEITKFGSELIIQNEIKFLEVLRNSNFVPKVHRHVLKPNNCFVVMEKLDGARLDVAVDNPKFWKIKNIKSFIRQCVEFNKVLIKHDILHRDIKPDNILVNFNKKNEIEIKLIDFGWAIKISQIKDSISPYGLGSYYRYSEGQYSDLYSTGKIVKKIFKGFRFKDAFLDHLKVHPNTYFNKESILERLKENEINLKKIERNFGLRDFLISLSLRHKLIFDLLIELKRFFKIKLKS